MNPTTVAVIHTSPITIEVFARVLARRLPEAKVINLLDDSVLPQLRENGGDITAVAPRWRQYARIARDRGVDVILNASASIGELCLPAEKELGIPVVRVDAAMAVKAVETANLVAVVATLPCTLSPASRLVKGTALEHGREVEVVPVLVEGAYAALMGGDGKRHDELVAAALSQAIIYADSVVLAQASMARVLLRLPAAHRAKCLASPELAVANVMEQVQTVGVARSASAA